MSVLCSMLYLYLCSLFLCGNSSSDCRSTQMCFSAQGLAHTLVETCSSPPADLYQQNTAEIFQWSQLKVTLVYFGTVVTLRYDDCATNGPGQRVIDSVQFLLCCMVSAQLCVCWEEEYAMSLCCCQYSLFRFFSKRFLCLCFSGPTDWSGGGSCGRGN